MAKETPQQKKARIKAEKAARRAAKKAQPARGLNTGAKVTGTTRRELRGIFRGSNQD